MEAFECLLMISLVTNGKLTKTRHFDSKAEVEDYIRQLGIPATFVLVGYYMSNLAGMSLREMPDGSWGLALPTPADAPIPLFDAEDDTGKFVKGIFLNRDKLLGERVYAATAYYTPAQIIEEFKQSYPKVASKTAYAQIPGEVYKGILGSIGLPESFQDEMLDNHLLFAEAGYFGGAKLDASQAVSWTHRPR
jgi:NmrA-like family